VLEPSQRHTIALPQYFFFFKKNQYLLHYWKGSQRSYTWPKGQYIYTKHRRQTIKPERETTLPVGEEHCPKVVVVTRDKETLPTKPRKNLTWTSYQMVDYDQRQEYTITYKQKTPRNKHRKNRRRSQHAPSLGTSLTSNDLQESRSSPSKTGESNGDPHARLGREKPRRVLATRRTGANHTDTSSDHCDRKRPATATRSS